MYITIVDDIEINRELRSVRKDGQEIHLTGLEYGLLDYLSNHANRICSRGEILDHVWGTRFQYDTGTIDVHLNASHLFCRSDSEDLIPQMHPLIPRDVTVRGFIIDSVTGELQEIQ